MDSLLWVNYNVDAIVLDLVRQRTTRSAYGNVSRMTGDWGLTCLRQTGLMSHSLIGDPVFAFLPYLYQAEPAWLWDS